MKDLQKQFYDAFTRAVADSGNIRKFSQLTGIPYATLWRYADGNQTPDLQKLGKLMPYLEKYWDIDESLPSEYALVRKVAAKSRSGCKP